MFCLPKQMSLRAEPRKAGRMAQQSSVTRGLPRGATAPLAMTVLKMGREGVEPSRCCHRQILSLLRLPIPPSPQTAIFYRILNARISVSKLILRNRLYVSTISIRIYVVPTSASVPLAQERLFYFRQKYTSFLQTHNK